MKNEKLRNMKIIFNMLREFYYEKNGKEKTIEFLEKMIKELKEKC